MTKTPRKTRQRYKPKDEKLKKLIALIRKKKGEIDIKRPQKARDIYL